MLVWCAFSFNALKPPGRWVGEAELPEAHAVVKGSNPFSAIPLVLLFQVASEVTHGKLSISSQLSKSLSRSTNHYLIIGLFYLPLLHILCKATGLLSDISTTSEHHVFEKKIYVVLIFPRPIRVEIAIKAIRSLLSRKYLF